MTKPKRRWSCNMNCHRSFGNQCASNQWFSFPTSVIKSFSIRFVMIMLARFWRWRKHVSYGKSQLQILHPNAFVHASSPFLHMFIQKSSCSYAQNHYWFSALFTLHNAQTRGMVMLKHKVLGKDRVEKFETWLFNTTKLTNAKLIIINLVTNFIMML